MNLHHKMQTELQTGEPHIYTHELKQLAIQRAYS